MSKSHNRRVVYQKTVSETKEVYDLDGYPKTSTEGSCLYKT